MNRVADDGYHRGKEKGFALTEFFHGGEALCLERMMGVEPTLSAWEANVLPMNYIRVTNIV